MANVLDFGADPTGTADSLPAFQAAIDSFAPPHPPVPYDGQGGVIFVPRGVYRLNGTLKIRRRTRITGETGGGRFASTCLTFENADQTSLDGSVAACIEVYGYDGVSPLRGDGTTIEDLNIEGPGRHNFLIEGVTTVGIYAWSSVHFQNVGVSRCSGDGIFIDGRDGRSSASPMATRNANSWSLIEVFVEDCGGVGVRVDGQDTNAGLGSGVIVSDCTMGGICDSSFLNSTWVGCSVHSAAVPEGPGYKSEGQANKSLFLGCYDETGGLPIELSNRSMWIGGVHGNGFAETNAFILESNFSASGLTFRNKAVGGREVSLGVVTPTDGRTYLQIKLSKDPYEHTVRDDDKWLQIGRYTGSGKPGLEITGSGVVMSGGEVQGGLLLLGGHFEGNRSSPRWVGYAASLSTGLPDVSTFGPTGQRPWVDGDRIYDTSPLKWIGWVRVIGSWRRFGSIEQPPAFTSGLVMPSRGAFGGPE